MNTVKVGSRFSSKQSFSPLLDILLFCVHYPSASWILSAHICPFSLFRLAFLVLHKKPVFVCTKLLLVLVFFFYLSVFTFNFKPLRWDPDEIQWVAIPPEIKFLLLYLSYALLNNSCQNLLLQGELSYHIALGFFLILNNRIVSSQISLVEGEHPFSHIAWDDW